MKNVYRNENSLIFQNKFFDLETGELLSPIETQNYRIVQVAESHFNGKFGIESHRQHCDMEVTYPLTGGMVCHTNETADTLNRHEVYLSFKGDTHALSGTRCRFQTLAFNVKEGPALALLGECKARFSAQRTVPLSEIAPLLSAIMAEFLQEDLPFAALHLDSLITQVFIKLLRGNAAGATAAIGSPEEKLAAILTYLDLHFLEIRSLEELSARFGYTYSHICKLFKAAFGCTPSTYLNTKKLEYSVSLLKKGAKLGEIAETLGYSTPYNFSRAFKQHFGVSPQRFLASLP